MPGSQRSGRAVNSDLPAFFCELAGTRKYAQRDSNLRPMDENVNARKIGNK